MSTLDLDSEELRTMMPSLLRYAAGRLRRAPSSTEPADLVNASVLSLLDARRRWNAAAVDLAGFLRGVIRSHSSSDRKAHARRKAAPPDLERENPTPEDDLLGASRDRELCAIVEMAIGGDRDLALLWAAVWDGALKREDIAEELGWSPDRVTAARIKLQRRLRALLRVEALPPTVGEP